MILIETEKAVILINEAEISDLHYKKEENKAIIHFRDYVGEAPNIKSIKAYPGTPDMIFVNNVEPEPEPEPKPKDYENDSILVLYNELKRIEEEEKERKKEQHPGFKYFQRKGNATRVIVVARQHDINTIGDLLKVGRITFQSFRNAGPKCGELITQGLSNLYGIEKW